MSDCGVPGQERQVCNLEYLLVNLGRNRAAARRLVGLFLENHPKLINRLDDAVSRQDALALKDAVHDIRSSCVLFSAQDAVALARNIEQELQHRCADASWSEDVVRLKREMALVAEELAGYLAEDEL
ncbi:Hpt domain-containing protein [Azonexus sp. R2A61]|uniref:Hpt domain-containing protein n=1 Tax=Azonexus sp. R2A61 TaxID=2744443 RepID=UPI001F19B2A6|nr:Hpt domain-containing protein [Azonexus sp. R2A61]